MTMHPGDLAKQVGVQAALYHGERGVQPDWVEINPDDWEAIIEFVGHPQLTDHMQMNGMPVRLTGDVPRGEFRLGQKDRPRLGV